MVWFGSITKSDITNYNWNNYQIGKSNLVWFTTKLYLPPQAMLYLPPQVSINAAKLHQDQPKGPVSIAWHPWIFSKTCLYNVIIHQSGRSKWLKRLDVYIYIVYRYIPSCSCGISGSQRVTASVHV